MTRQTLGIGMGLNLPEAAPKGQMLVWCDLLVPDKDYEVVMQRLPNGGESCVVQFPERSIPWISAPSALAMGLTSISPPFMGIQSCSTVTPIIRRRRM